jgi:2-oxoglutarate dehydrogenase E1 component
MQPKSLLRLKDAGASMDDINEGTHFRPVLPEASPESLIASEDVKRVIFCSGKVYYDLARARALNDIDDIAIAR